MAIGGGGVTLQPFYLTAQRLDYSLGETMVQFSPQAEEETEPIFHIWDECAILPELLDKRMHNHPWVSAAASCEEPDPMGIWWVPPRSTPSSAG